MSGAGDETPEDRSVGYGRPPVEHQFRKGQSGNPRGRPRKLKVPTWAVGLSGALQPVKDWIMEEAHRTVTLREGEETIEMPVIQAVLRRMGVSAIKGDPVATKLLIGMTRTLEQADYDARIEAAMIALDYKSSAYAKIEHCRQNRLPEPVLIPHPDDVEVDPSTGGVQFTGPTTKEEHAELLDLVAMREGWIEEVGRLRRGKGKEAARQRAILLAGNERMIALRNADFPKRYQRTADDVFDKHGKRRTAVSGA